MANAAAVAAAELKARRQYGLFSTADALALGVTRTMLTHHSRPGGRWRRIAPRVYEVRAQPGDWRRPLAAAQLWGGPEAVLSHRSAGALLDIDGQRRGPVELYRPGGLSHHPWVVRRGAPPPSDIMTTGRLRHTTPLRTFTDLAGTLDDDGIELALEWLLRNQHASLDDLKGMTAGLRRVLAQRPPGAPPTGSELETRFVQITRSTAIPDWVRQHPVWLDGRDIFYLDLCQPDIGLFTELDGRWAHSSSTAIFADRHRQNLIVKLLGWLPLRYTWDDIVDRPVATARDVESTYRRQKERH